MSSDRTGQNLQARQAVMAICAAATLAELEAALDRVAPGVSGEDVRRPQCGLVMLRGRMGGDGRAFNAGEATVARATVSIGDGRTGYAYQLGRDLRKARAAALIDALWQGDDRADVEAALGPIRVRLTDEADILARRTAATRVNFFTMVRGEVA